MPSGHEALPLRPIDKPSDVCYAASVARIGLLGVDLVEDVVYVYSRINGFRVGFDILARSHKEMSSAEFQMRASLCCELLEQALRRGETLIPRLRQRARQDFLGQPGEVDDNSTAA